MKKTKLKPEQLRNSTPLPDAVKNLPRNRIYFILDDIMDTYNIGTIFRLADAIAAEKMYLCGITEAPPNIKVQRASINTWQWVKWEKKITAQKAVDDLRKAVPKIKVIAVEQADNSVFYSDYNYKFPLAFVVGHETRGISPEVLSKCDEIVELPMYGVNHSLNVIVALSVVVYKSLENLY